MWESIQNVIVVPRTAAQIWRLANRNQRNTQEKKNKDGKNAASKPQGNA